MASKIITSFFPGISSHTGDSDPNGVLAAERGSTLIRTDAGNVSTYLNTNGLTAWSRGIGVDVTGDLNLTYVDQFTLLDNTLAALQIGSAGALNLLTFDTTNGAEQVEYSGALPFQINTGGLTVAAGTVSLPQASLNVANVTTDAANTLVTAGLYLRVAVPANALGVSAGTTAVLPARVGGWRAVEVYLISVGPAAGTITVQNGGVNVTNALTVGAANTITRATTLDTTTGLYASGGTVTFLSAATTSAAEVFVRVEPL
jgi:hypothetical protein